jgi:putative flippase GtrA
VVGRTARLLGGAESPPPQHVLADPLAWRPSLTKTPMATPPSTAEALSDVAASAMGEPVDISQLAIQSPDVVETTLPLFSSLLMLCCSGAALGITVYFFLMLSDLTEDLINPYTFCERVNTRLHYEMGAHVSSVFAVLLSLHPLLLFLSLPGLGLRSLWHQQKKLVIDPTTCFNTAVQSQLRTRWGLMAVWHGVASIFAFVQCVSLPATPLILGPSFFVSDVARLASATLGRT